MVQSLEFVERLLRYWHYYTGESRCEIYKTDDEETMKEEKLTSLRMQGLQ